MRGGIRMTMHYPKSREDWLKLRHQYVGSTESSALFGLNKYATAYELGVIKQSAEPIEYEGNERTEWGLALQFVIARKIAEEHGVKVRAMNGYAVNNGMGASFDYEIVGVTTEPDADSEVGKLYRKHGAGVLEIKNVDGLIYRNEWTAEEAPAHIEVQVQHQLECCEREWAVIGVLVGGNKLVTLLRLRDAAVGLAIARKVQEFWKNLNAGILPAVKLPDDADIIAKVYKYAEPGQVKDAQGDADIADLCIQYYDAGHAVKVAEMVRATAKAQLLQLIGTAEKVLCDGYTISCGVVGETEVAAYTRQAYRNFQVRQKKQEKRVSSTTNGARANTETQA